jgi:hypothetical protein
MALVPNWRAIGLACWFDPMLGKFTDRELARLVGTDERRIARRRKLFAIDAYSISQAIEPYRHLLGVESDVKVARASGASVRSVRDYRQAQGIAPRSLSKPRPLQKRLPIGHPVRPLLEALRLVAAEDVAAAANVPVSVVLEVCAALGIKPPAPDRSTAPAVPLENVPGPWLGFESLLGTMSSAKISRAVGVPLTVVEQRREFLGVRYQRVSKAQRYVHLFGILPNHVIAKLAGVSTARILDMRKNIAKNNLGALPR